MTPRAEAFWEENGEWLTQSWRGQVKAVYEDDSDITHVVWRGPLPSSVRDRLGPYVERGEVSLQIPEPGAKEHVVAHAARALDGKGLAVVDEVQSREQTARSEGLVIVVDDPVQAKSRVVETLNLVAHEYSPALAWALVQRSEADETD